VDALEQFSVLPRWLLVKRKQEHNFLQVSWVLHVFVNLTRVA